MTRDEALKELNDEIKKVLPDNKDLDEDDFDTLHQVAEDVLEEACGVVSEVDEEEDEEAP